MSERLEFLQRLERGERMSDLCREYGISRKTGYKFKARFEAMGLAGVADRSRAPQRSPWRTPDAIRELLVQARLAHPTWGPRKLRVVVGRDHPGVRLPAPSTIWRILKSEGLVVPRRRRRRYEPRQEPLSHATAPNAVWCVDYKGQFRLGNGAYCYPLTITDAHSRFIVACDGLENTRTVGALPVFERVFGEYGLPKVIRSDNGAPFAGSGLLGLSRLSAWWTSLGVRHERIRPGKPQENGRHERMHRTLKRETTRPAASSFLGQQEKFDAFVKEFNDVRPHEALGDATPSSVYVRSPRRLEDSKPLRYPLDDFSVRVHANGRIRPPARTGLGLVFLGTALAGHPVGLRELEDGRWLVRFAALTLGVCTAGSRELHPYQPQAKSA